MREREKHIGCYNVANRLERDWRVEEGVAVAGSSRMSGDWTLIAVG